MSYQIFELLCRKCGETINRRLSQFDELPDCNKCGNNMIVENVTTIKENEKCINPKS
jgi:NAD-dependent SIR2 family protein deacetylase